MTTLCLVVSILCSPVALPARNPRMPWQVAVNNRSMRRRKQRKRATRERTDTLNEIEQLKTTNAELLKALEHSANKNSSRDIFEDLLIIL